VIATGVRVGPVHVFIFFLRNHGQDAYAYRIVCGKNGIIDSQTPIIIVIVHNRFG